MFTFKFTSTITLTITFTLTLCRFNTTKEGMKEGAAARHLKIEHKVTDAMMTNSPEGSYRFKKDKQEN